MLLFSLIILLWNKIVELSVEINYTMNILNPTIPCYQEYPRLYSFFSCSEHEFDPDSYKIPFVILCLKTFASQVHTLLQTHEGTVPLLR